MKMISSINDLVASRGKEILTKVDDTMDSLEQFSVRLDRLLEDNAQSFGIGMQSLTELGPAIRQFHLTLGALEEIVRRIEENPAGYLLGRERVKEFQP
ncbi:MAG: hypothetical protein JXA46_08075 [Dehalococcoidales bacterium]|nr:hypothetical protein [Dehalococcoidales bacterium]